jgi:hypothetical protein
MELVKSEKPLLLAYEITLQKRSKLGELCQFISLQVLLLPLSLLLQLLISLQVLLLPIKEIHWNPFLKMVKFPIQPFKVLQLLIILRTHCVWLLKDNLDHQETNMSNLTWTAQILLGVRRVESNNCQFINTYNIKKCFK